MEGGTVFMIDQNELPFDFSIAEMKNFRATCRAIKHMTVRGAGAIGAAAGFAMAQAFLQAPPRGREEFVDGARYEIESTRPTARNLFYAVDRVYRAGLESAENAVIEAQEIAERFPMDLGTSPTEMVPASPQAFARWLDAYGPAPILLVMQPGVVRDSLVRAAEHRRLSVVVAETGQSAFAACHQHRPLAIFCDAVLPDAEG